MKSPLALRPALRETVAPGTEDERILEGIDGERLPRHVAVIMDGNGRWAARRELPRVEGHRSGIDAVRETVQSCARLGIEVLTLFAFSRENWKRPKPEIDTLMELLSEYLRGELADLHGRGIRFRAIGRLDDLPEVVQRDIAWATETTASNANMTFNVALSYGSRTEIVDACNALLAHAASGALEAPVDEAEFEACLYTAGQPDPDLVIRTSGEYRLSNFLLWQAAYAEIWTTDVLWPDFRQVDLFRAVADFQRRERRYGGVDPIAGPIA